MVNETKSVKEKKAKNLQNVLKDNIEHIDLGQEKSENLQGEKKFNKKTKWTVLKETFVEFSQRTDLNVYGKLFAYENLLVKLVWLIALIGSFGLTAWVVRLNVLSYLDYDVVSQIGIVYEAPTEFPAVTFCDNNPFTVNFPDNINIKDLTNKNDLKYGAIMAASDPAYVDENRKLLGLNISQITDIGLGQDYIIGDFAYCRYNNTDCSSDLHWYWHYDYGNCFQLNVGLNSSNLPIDLKEANREGSDFGLQISVVPLVNFLSYDSRKIGMLSYPAGMVVFVHNASLRPLKSDQVFVKTGERTFISVRRTFVNNANSPYTECQDLTSYSSPLFDFIKSSNYSAYRQKDCFNLCIQESIIATCNCSYSGFDNL